LVIELQRQAQTMRDAADLIGLKGLPVARTREAISRNRNL